MQCPQCHSEAASGAEFCSECGAQLTIVCSRCGTSNPFAHKFCKECGQRLMRGAGVDSGLERAQPLPVPDIPDKARTAAGLEDERKHVSVLFADIKSSLELMADRDPEDMSRLLDSVLQRMIDGVHRYEGTINRVMGDGIMALFGAPIALENHAVRACCAALLIRDNVKTYSEELRRTEGINIQVRIGVNSGEVIVKSVSSDMQMDYTAVGQTTHLAARMEQIAAPGSILITADVMNLAEGYIEATAIGPVPVKGLRAPVQVFEVTGAGSPRSRLQATAGRELTQFVGRASEMRTLREALQHARASAGQAVSIVGEAGLGKSRLLYEFIRSEQIRGCLVLECNSVSYGRGPAYPPIVEFIKSYFNIDPRDSPRSTREKVTSSMVMLDSSLHEAIPPVLYLLDLLSEDHPFARLEPLQRREQTVDAIRRILLQESRHHPAVIVFEDLQWNDSLTVDVLDCLLDVLPGNRLLILVSYRPDHQGGWGARPSYRQLLLHPLPHDGVGDLLNSLLGPDLGLAPAKRLLAQRTDGNPFFIEEIIRNLVETGALVGDRGRYFLAKPISDVDVPPMVQAVIAARIDRLPTEEKHLIREASVIGKDVPFPLLHMISGLPEVKLRRQLANLKAADFLYEVRLFPDIEYTFEHALTHQVAYAGVLHDHRRHIHARVLESMERLHSGRLPEQVERLAHHAFHGGAWSKAVPYLREAGSRAVERTAHREAVRFFEEALKALDHLPDARTTVEQAIDVRFDLRNALQPLGELGQIIEHLREAERLAARIDDQRRLGWVASYLTEHFRMLGDYASAASAGERALAIAQRSRDVPLRVVTNLPMGLLCHAKGEYRRAIEFLQWNVEHLDSRLSNERFGLFGLPFVHSRSFLAYCFAELGEFERGRAFAEEAVVFAKAAEHPFSLMYAYLGIGTVHLRKGDLQHAIHFFERALESGEFLQIPVGFSYGASYLGYALALAGHAAKGLPLLEQTTGPMISERFVARHSLRLAYVGEAYLLVGRIDEAARAAAEALEHARVHGERGHEAYALRLLGEVHGKLDDVERAETRYSAALSLAQELEMRPLAAHCHWGLARLSGRRPHGSAQQHVTAALTLFRAMDMLDCLHRLQAEFT
jgi:class 3 adenylate cyclase/tetratricopeptide (TPR) repeat protein